MLPGRSTGTWTDVTFELYHSHCTRRVYAFVFLHLCVQVSGLGAVVDLILVSSQATLRLSVFFFAKQQYTVSEQTSAIAVQLSRETHCVLCPPRNR